MAFAVQSASDPLCGRVEGAGATPPEGYSPPLISNGDLNMLVEWTGARGQSPESWKDYAFRLPDGKGGWLEKRVVNGQEVGK